MQSDLWSEASHGASGGFRDRHRWLRLIESGKVANLAAIAKSENINNSYVSRIVNLTTLDPDIQAAILDEAQPDTVSLFDLAVDMPIGWAEHGSASGLPDRLQGSGNCHSPPAGIGKFDFQAPTPPQ
jgi:hypothetical protein